MIDELPSTREANQLIRDDQLAPIELVEFCLDRISRFDGRIRAWVLVDADGARREAERLGKMASQGRILGPLHGVTVGIKDIIDVHGMPTKAGSPLCEGHVALRDAPVVAKLRESGAIILGKTVTTEFACFDPPPTRNPWNLSHTPGGSSSGSAAAVAMQMCMAAIGSQTGGSITRPASYCGVAGLKSSLHAVSTEGVVPVSRNLDHVGPIAGTVDDLWAVFQAIDQRDDRRQRLDEQPGRIDGAEIGVAEASRAMPRLADDWPGRTGNPPSLHVIEEFFLEEAEADVLDVTRAALARLQDSCRIGANLRLPPSFADAHQMHWRIMAVETANVHRESYQAGPEAFGPKVSSLIEEGLATSAVDYTAALDHQLRFRQDIEVMFRAGGIAVTPATSTTAPDRLDTTGDPSFNSPWSHAGVPTVSIPCGLGANGMPCALQFVGPVHSEQRLLQAASWCEQQLGFHHVPPEPTGGNGGTN